MSIQFTCPHCGVQTDVADEYAGQSGPCARCGNTITILPPGAPPTYASPARSSQGPAVIIVIVVAALAVVLVCGGVLVALLLPPIGAAREAARRARCQNNLKQISIALLTYEQANGCFPPAYIADEDGNPMHSWRVLILPYLERPDLYSMYNFDEPWDSPNNQMVADTIISVYSCPSYAGSDLLETNYVMIVGPGTVSDGAGTTESADIKDGTSNTIMVVEVANSGINWAEPRDLDAEQISYRINDQTAAGISSDHPGGACVVMCDGSVHFLDNSTDPEVIKGMSTIAGGEMVSLP